MTVIREKHPFDRLCECGHIKLVHRPGWCNVVQGCDCKEFRAIEPRIIIAGVPRGEA